MQNTTSAYQLLNGEFLKQANTISQLILRISELEDANRALRREMIEQASEDTDADDTPTIEAPPAAVAGIASTAAVQHQADDTTLKPHSPVAVVPEPEITHDKYISMHVAR